MKKSANAKIKALLLTGISFAVLTFGYADMTDVVKADETTTNASLEFGKSSVTAHYQDENGSKLAEDQTIDGHIAVGYGTMRKAVDGYTLKDWQGPTEGYFQDQPQTVTYIYAKGNDNVNNEQKPENGTEQPTTPDADNQKPENGTEQPTTPGADSQKPKDTHKANKQNVGKTSVNKQTTTGQEENNQDPANNSAQLPQTGAKNTSFGLVFAGISAIAVSLLGMLGFRRKQN